MTHLDGRLHLRELASVASQCGFTGEQVRSCLRRMVAEGVYERVRGGRDAVYYTTELGMQLLDERRRHHQRGFAQDASSTRWDGAWHLVAFGIPEARRDARDALRERLVSLGGAALQGGLYVSPHAWEERVRAAAKQLEVEGFVSLVTTRALEVAGTSEPRLIAESLWPIAGLEAGYRRFVRTFGAVPKALEQLIRVGGAMADAEIVPGALLMAESWTTCSATDPLLPPELLPRPWAGREARDVLLRSRRLVLTARRERGVLTLFSSFDDTVESQPLAPTPEEESR